MEHATDDERRPRSPEPLESTASGSSSHVTESDTSNDDNSTNLAATDRPADGVESQGCKDRPISGVVPPYWRHHRAASRASLASVDTSRNAKPAITLEDHSGDPDATSTRGLWAKSVTIDDHVVVSGKTGIGAYVVWMCKVQTLDGGPMIIPMRYSEFDELRQLLARAFPHATNALPPLPPKSVLFKFSPKFLESRRVGLQYFLNCVLLNPEFSGAPVLKDYLFSRAD